MSPRTARKQTPDTAPSLSLILDQAEAALLDPKVLEQAREAMDIVDEVEAELAEHFIEITVEDVARQKAEDEWQAAARARVVRRDVMGILVCGLGGGLAIPAWISAVCALASAHTILS